MTKISFIIPCYNEENNVIGAIETAQRAAAYLNLTYEIIVFDDASQDGTSRVVNEYKQQFPKLPLKLFQNKVNKGVAYNFVEGAFQATGEYCRLTCGDNVDAFDTYLALLKEMGNFDIIIPYYKTVIGRPLYRQFISILFTKIVNLLSGFSLKYYNGFPVLKRQDVIRWHVEATGLGFQAELLIRLLRQGKTYKEVEVTGYDREGTVSFRLRNILSVCHSIVKICVGRIRVSVLK